jgi:hypothetical protein
MQTQPAEVTPPTNPIFPTEKLGPIEETFPIIVFPIDINTADKDTIMALPGIGEVLHAQRNEGLSTLLRFRFALYRSGSRLSKCHGVLAQVLFETALKKRSCAVIAFER